MTSINSNCDVNNILLNILKSIDKKNKFTSIFVSIASLENEILHDSIKQYPAFLEMLKEEIPFEPLYIILIDPSIDSLPFIVKNLWNSNISDDWIEIESNKLCRNYFNKISNIYVYVINSEISFKPQIKIDENTVNIDKFFDTLNRLSIMYGWFSVIHDFTGRSSNNLALHYDNFLQNDIDHIIYGLGTRTENIHFDFTKPEYNFIYNITENGIKVFNPYKSPQEFENTIISKLNTQIKDPKCTKKTKIQYNILMSQIHEYITSKRKFIIIDLMTMIKHIGILLQNNINNTNDDVVNKLGDNLYIKNNYCSTLSIMIKNTEYNDVFNILINILKIELTEHIQIIYKENTQKVINNTINKIIECKNPHNWIFHLKKLLNDFDKLSGINL
jgi:hypothetical protein